MTSEYLNCNHYRNALNRCGSRTGAPSVGSRWSSISRRSSTTARRSLEQRASPSRKRRPPSRPPATRPRRRRPHLCIATVPVARPTPNRCSAGRHPYPPSTPPVSPIIIDHCPDDSRVKNSSNTLYHFVINILCHKDNILHCQVVVCLLSCVWANFPVPKPGFWY